MRLISLVQYTHSHHAPSYLVPMAHTVHFLIGMSTSIQVESLKPGNEANNMIYDMTECVARALKCLLRALV